MLADKFMRYKFNMTFDLNPERFFPNYKEECKKAAMHS